MKTIKLFLLSLIALFILNSCTIKHTVSFNEDMSGNNEMIIDYGELMEQMSGLMNDSSKQTKNMDLDKGLDGLTTSFKDIEGLTNINTIQEAKKGLLGFSFDFKDTKTLSEAMSKYLEDDIVSKKKNASTAYIQKKKTLILNFDEQDLGGMKESLGDESMIMMGSFEYEFTVNFPFAIKSIDNKLYTVSVDRKSMSANVNLEDYLSGKESLSAKVKW